MIIVMNIGCDISSNDMTTYYVTPDITRFPCPKDQPCNILDTYIKNSSYYFRSNTTFVFYPGNHVLNEENLTIIQNCENIQFFGIGNITQHSISEVLIFPYKDAGQCNYDDAPITFHQSSSVINCSVPSGFAFINITNLTILNITIYGCGAPVPSIDVHNINNLTASLLIINGHDMKLEGLSIQMGSGYGLLAVSIQGHAQIMDSSFINNNVLSVINGGNKIQSVCFYSDPCISNYSVYNPIYWLTYARNAWTEYNFAPGGNALLLYPDETADKSNASLEISNSLFSLGYDTSYIYVPDSVYPVLTTPCYPYGTGLTISAHQTTYDLFVNISDSISYRNQASCGSNFYFTDYSGRSPIHQALEAHV